MISAVSAKLPQISAIAAGSCLHLQKTVHVVSRGKRIYRVVGEKPHRRKKTDEPVNGGFATRFGVWISNAAEFFVQRLVQTNAVCFGYAVYAYFDRCIIDHCILRHFQNAFQMGDE